MAKQLPFEQIGGYRVLREIGRGGMATVFQVQDDAGKIFALKLLHQGPQHTDKKWSVRFEREFRLLSKLRHPNLIAVHDYGEQGDYPYFVMDFIEGTDLWSFYQKQLRSHNTEGRLRLLLPLLAQMISSLDYIHTHRVVHQDLKPANVLLDASFEHVYLADFGLARELRHDISVVTHAGFLGTLGYAPPEIVERGRLDGRADLYSLGVILYICFADRRPIPVKGRALHEVAIAVLEEEPPPILSFCPDLPPLMAEVIHRCMQKDATQRFVNAKALWAALRPMYQAFFDDREDSSVSISLPVSAVPSVPMVGGWSPQMVGRETELAEIKGRLELLSRKHQGGIVLVRGGTGVGKSHFLEEVAHQAQTEISHVVRLAFRPHHAPYQSLAEFLLAIYPHMPGALRKDPCIQILAHYLPLMREHLDIPSLEMPPLRQPAEEIWGLLFPLLLDLFAEGPQVWLWDDLQHADAASLHILRKMFAFFLEEGTLPLLMVGAMSRSAGALLELPKDDARILHFDLNALSKEEEAALVVQLTGLVPSEAELTQIRLFSDGVPLRSMEYLHQEWLVQQAAEELPSASRSGAPFQLQMPASAEAVPLWVEEAPASSTQENYAASSAQSNKAAPTTQPPPSEGTQVLQLSDLIFEEDGEDVAPQASPEVLAAARELEQRKKALTRTLVEPVQAFEAPESWRASLEDAVRDANLSSAGSPSSYSSSPTMSPRGASSHTNATLLELRSPFVAEDEVQAPSSQPVAQNKSSQNAQSKRPQTVYDPELGKAMFAFSKQLLEQNQKPASVAKPPLESRPPQTPLPLGKSGASRSAQRSSDLGERLQQQRKAVQSEGPAVYGKTSSSEEGDTLSSSREQLQKRKHTMDPQPWPTSAKVHRTQDGLMALSRAEETEMLSELNSDSTPHDLPHVREVQAPKEKPHHQGKASFVGERDQDSASSSLGLRKQTRGPERDQDSTDQLPQSSLLPHRASDLPSHSSRSSGADAVLPPLFFHPEEIEELELEMEPESPDIPSGGLSSRRADLPSGGGAFEAIPKASPVGLALSAQIQGHTPDASYAEQTSVMSQMPMLEALRAEMAWRSSLEEAGASPQNQGSASQESWQDDSFREDANTAADLEAERRRALAVRTAELESYDDDFEDEEVTDRGRVLVAPEERPDLASPYASLDAQPYSTKDDEGDRTGVNAVSPLFSSSAAEPPSFSDTEEAPQHRPLRREPLRVASPEMGPKRDMSASELAIRPLLESRLALLPSASLPSVRRCAFLAEEFSFEELHSVCGGGRDEALDLINHLLRLRLVQLRNHGQDERYAFSFLILRDVLRDPLSEEEQATHALRAAQAMLKHRAHRELVVLAPLLASLCSQGGAPKEAFYWQLKSIEYAIQVRLPEALEKGLLQLKEMLRRWSELGEQELLLNMIPSLMQEHNPQLEPQWTNLVYYLLWMGCLFELGLEDRWKSLQKGLHKALQNCDIHSREGWYQATKVLLILRPSLRFSGLSWFSEEGS